MHYGIYHTHGGCLLLPVPSVVSVLQDTEAVDPEKSNTKPSDNEHDVSKGLGQVVPGDIKLPVLKRR